LEKWLWKHLNHQKRLSRTKLSEKAPFGVVQENVTKYPKDTEKDLHECLHKWKCCWNRYVVAQERVF
jgi:hypothetical protein